ncbi:MAG: hypothetical protein JNK87_07500 [Bryobacterales bacterium]|nr:hypothetical protein [Bryobacterales bacterium]
MRATYHTQESQPKPLGHLPEVDEVHAALNREFERLKQIVLSSTSDETRKASLARSIEYTSQYVGYVVEGIQDTDAEAEALKQRPALRNTDSVEIEITH